MSKLKLKTITMTTLFLKTIIFRKNQRVMMSVVLKDYYILIFSKLSGGTINRTQDPQNGESDR